MSVFEKDPTTLPFITLQKTSLDAASDPEASSLNERKWTSEITNAEAEITWDRGYKEWTILVEFEDEADQDEEVDTEAWYVDDNDKVCIYRFGSEDDAIECAEWLEGRRLLAVHD